MQGTLNKTKSVVESLTEQRVKSDSVPVSDLLPGIKSIQSLPETSRQTLITYNSEQSLSSHDAFRW